MIRRLDDWRVAVDEGLAYPSHFRPVVRHRRQVGFSSSHFTLRILAPE